MVLRVSPVSLGGCGSCNYQPLINALRPDAPNVFDDINGVSEKSNPAAYLFDTINFRNQSMYGSRDRAIRSPEFVNTWLQYPNDIIRNLAMAIVDPSDSNDIKMEKIQRWVVHNIQYMTDEEQYGYDELWVPPVLVLNTGKGDCEDGAFLIMSLALNAGVDPARLRMYGGFVDSGPGAASGGHGWTAYRRESDDQWVAVDFSYYPDLRPMENRIPVKDDKRYVDDYFFITQQYIVYTENTNRIRDPEVYFADGRMTPNIFFPSGTVLSLYA